MARIYMGRAPDPDEDFEENEPGEDAPMLLFDEKRVPTRDEVRKFTGRLGQCCTIENFRPDLLGTPKSEWNQSVAQVFAKKYVTEETAKCTKPREVEEAFSVHMKTLIKAYKRFLESDSDRTGKLRKQRRYMRKQYVSPCVFYSLWDPQNSPDTSHRCVVCKQPHLTNCSSVMYGSYKHLERVG